MKAQTLYILIPFLCLVGCGGHPGDDAKPHLIWSQVGSEPQEEFGHKAAAVGDVTGSGYGDLLVGAPGYSGRKGRAVLYLGSPEGLSQTPIWTAVGEKPGDGFGDVVGSLGDITGDGYMDFFVSAAEYSDGQFHQCGKVYVYMGGPHGPSETPSWTMEGTSSNELFGDCATSVGDVNGDGYPDFMIGAYGFDDFRGKAFLYLGGPGGYASKPCWTFTGEEKGDWLGYGIGPAGDVKGNGYGGVLLASKYYSHPYRNAGKVYVFYGSAKGLPSKPDWVHYGEMRDSRFGSHLSSAGDVNGDGYADAVIGSPGYDYSKGRAYIFLGSPTGFQNEPSEVVDGKVDGENFGTDVNSAENVSGSPCMSVLVSGPGYARFPGSASLFLGSPQGLRTDPLFREVGEFGGDSYGSIVGSACDVNGEGIPDWFVCAPGFDQTRGKVYVYQGTNWDGFPLEVYLYRKNENTLVGPGGGIRYHHDEPMVKFLAKNLSDEVKLQVEVKETGRAFDGKGLLTSNWMTGPQGSLTITDLKNKKAYRWRARLVFKKDGRRTPWHYPFFERLTGDPDFRMLP